jgi:cell division protein ZapE
MREPATVKASAGPAASDQSPLSLYRAKLAAGELRADPAQALAAEKLETLYRALKDYQPQSGPGFWRAHLGFARGFGLSSAGAPPMGLYLVGNVGTGKSMLMDLFFATAPLPKKRRVHFHAFMLEVHERLHKWRQKEAKATANADPIPPLAERIAGEAWLLCFDEFQVTNIADAVILGRLFGALFERGVVVVATSNTAPDDLYKGGLQRELFLPAIEILKKKMDVLQIDSGTDYRLGRVEDVAVYHTPLGPEATAALEAAFRRFADEDETPGPTEIVILGRKLKIPCAAGRVAMMSFAELCEQPLGPADYVAIASHFHTLVVDGIPVLSPDQRDVTRRFITLIDELYEHRVNLFCAAAAPPDQLVSAGDYAKEFRRTASRLHEMQSEDYLESPHLT